MAPRSPLPRLGEAERIRLLRLRGLDANLKPLNLTPEERHAMSDPSAPPVPEQPPVAPQPAAGAIVNQRLVRVLTVVGIVASAALAASEAGALPAWVSPVAQAVIGLLAAVGVASPGIRKQG